MIYRLMYIAVQMLSYIPFAVGHFLGKMLGTVFGLIPLGRTATSLVHIHQSFVDSMTRAEAAKLNRRVIIHFAQMFFEVPHILRLSPGNLEEYVVFEKQENLLRAIENGKGVFFLTGHLGNWELMSAAIAVRYEVGGGVVARPIDFEPLERLMTELRSRFGTEIIMRQRGMRRVLTTIKENKGVGILLDQNVDWYDGVFVKFFGRWACTNKGLALLALKTAAPVIPTFSVRGKDGRYRIIFENEIRLVRTGDKTKDVEVNTARFTDAIEKYIRAYPDQWFWFHKRWKTRPYCSVPETFYSAEATKGSRVGASLL